MPRPKRISKRPVGRPPVLRLSAPRVQEELAGSPETKGPSQVVNLRKWQAAHKERA